MTALGETMGFVFRSAFSISNDSSILFIIYRSFSSSFGSGLLAGWSTLKRSTLKNLFFFIGEKASILGNLPGAEEINMKLTCYNAKFWFMRHGVGGCSSNSCLYWCFQMHCLRYIEIVTVKLDTILLLTETSQQRSLDHALIGLHLTLISIHKKCEY